MGNTVYSGHTEMLGVDGLKHPGFLDPRYATNAVNRSFRGGKNQTRPPMRSVESVFEDSGTEEAFKRGSAKAVYPYQGSKSRLAQPHMIVEAHDRILKGRVAGNQINWSTLYKGTNPDILGSTFAQATDRLYWQDGKHRPVGWDGNRPAYVIGEGDDRMPLGVFMLYSQGRLIIVTPDGYIIISDYIYGNGLKDTKGVESFIEYQANDDLGAISAPGQLGPISGCITVPQLPNSTRNSQVLFMCHRGAFTLDLGGERGGDNGWLFGDILKTVMEGSGSTCGNSLTRVHSDIFYQSTEGTIESFKWKVTRNDNQWSEVSVSAEVEKYSRFTAPHDRRWADAMLFNNRLMFTSAITVERNAMGGAHHFGQGMVVLDLARGSTVNETSGFQWEGLWTGPNVVGFCDLIVDETRRPLMLSHDDDGINRVYELIDGSGDDELDGRRRKIISFYDTPYLFSNPDAAAPPLIHTLTAVRASTCDITAKASLRMEYRPASYQPWQEILPATEIGCDDIPEEFAQTALIAELGSFHGWIGSNSTENACEQASDRSIIKAAAFQIRLTMEGQISIPQLSVEADQDLDVIKSSCGTRFNDRACEFVKLDEVDPFFQYKIATP